MAFLLNVDMRGFNPKLGPPMTEAKADVIEASTGGLENFILSGMGDGYDQLYANGTIRPACDFQTSKTVWERYCLELKMRGQRPAPGETESACAALLGKYARMGKLHRFGQALNRANKIRVKLFRVVVFRNVRSWRNKTEKEALAHWNATHRTLEQIADGSTDK
jgi:hypothetical protein